MAENNKLSVTVDNRKINEDNNLKKFQKLLAYFVWHLEYLNYKDGNNKNEAFNGPQSFCNKPKTIIKRTGQGYNGDDIQDNIKEWELLKDGRVFISVKIGQKYSQGAYSTDGCYLHWAGIAGNVSIYAVWEDKPKNDGKYHITGLRVKNKWEKDGQPNLAEESLANLGIRVETNVKGNSYDSGSPSVTPKIGDFYDAFVKAAKLETKAVLEHAKNIIFTGAPGTGKTYMAKQIANLIGAETEFVQFHPSYDYTDFVEGLRPVKDTNDPNKIVFERKDGIFKAFCEKALKECKDAEQDNRVPKPYIFIIDEINRGEISKIFGELFFSVDPGYRGVSGAVKTQYANLQANKNEFDTALNSKDCGHFFIPENVYIIGTMNDIDRSVESMDFAFRRRFTFKEITAKETQLQILNSMTNGNNIDKLISRMNSLNEAISNSEEFSEAYHIGAAYFKHYEDYANQDKPFDKLWNNHIKGVLFEYLRGRPNAKEILEKWEIAYKQLVGDNKKGKKLEEAQEENVEE